MNLPAIAEERMSPRSWDYAVEWLRLSNGTCEHETGTAEGRMIAGSMPEALRLVCEQLSLHASDVTLFHCAQGD